jgi:hypothetical protein
MGVDDRPTDRQSHPYSARLRGVESLENAIEMVRINARPGIAHGHENATGPGLLGADQQLPWLRHDRAHGFDRVQDQVQHDLLQLNTIPFDGKQRLRKASSNRDSIRGDWASRQSNHFFDRLIQIETKRSRRRLLDVITDTIDDISGTIGIGHDAFQRFPDFA